MRKNESRSRRKVNLLKSRSDFHVPDTKMDPLKSKKVPNHKLLEDINLCNIDVDDDQGEILYENWEDRMNDDNINNEKVSDDHMTAIPEKVPSEKGAGRIYPLDLWFLLAEHLHPESVQAFAGICKGSFTVLKTYGFWASFYQRTFNNCQNSNKRDSVDEFKVSRVVRPLGIQSHVIKALFQIYPPFKEKLQRQELNSVDFDYLKGYKCSSYWISKSSKRSVFIIHILLQNPNFSEPADKTCIFNNTSEAVTYNPFKDSVVLQIICDQYTPIISPMGLYLMDIKYNSSRDMRNMRLELGMSTSCSSYKTLSRKQIPPEETKIIDPVTSVRVLNWWHPDFPSSIPSRIPDSACIVENWDT